MNKRLRRRENLFFLKLQAGYVLPLEVKVIDETTLTEELFEEFLSILRNTVVPTYLVEVSSGANTDTAPAHEVELQNISDIVKDTTLKFTYYFRQTPSTYALLSNAFTSPDVLDLTMVEELEEQTIVDLKDNEEKEETTTAKQEHSEKERKRKKKKVSQQPQEETVVLDLTLQDTNTDTKKRKASGVDESVESPQKKSCNHQEESNKSTEEQNREEDEEEEDEEEEEMNTDEDGLSDTERMEKGISPKQITNPFILHKITLHTLVVLFGDLPVEIPKDDHAPRKISHYFVK